MKNVFPQFELGFIAEKSLKDTTNPFDRLHELLNTTTTADDLGVAFLAGQVSYYLSLYIDTFNFAKQSGKYSEDVIEAACQIAIENDTAIKAYFTSLYDLAVANLH